ncbi:MAG TPA: thiol-disulfide isomerase, partial [Gammaproteobacteria bacterium]|nr:thiol-disulfide isomerase [Gammaproteobacteria bacterium]
GLRSPWALAIDGDKLFIAMAGAHQIWRLDLAEGKIRPWAGSGDESIDDGEIRTASFSQPSGLSILGHSLFVADAEVSAVRQIDTEKGTVTTVVGKGLFDFGDRDGVFDKARLQHVLGIAALKNGTVYVADTYNHKLKKLDLKTNRVSTVAGTGKPGKGEGKPLQAELNEPGGLAILDNTVLIADTNNNRIMRFDPVSDTLKEWKLRK